MGDGSATLFAALVAPQDSLCLTTVAVTDCGAGAVAHRERVPTLWAILLGFGLARCHLITSNQIYYSVVCSICQCSAERLLGSIGTTNSRTNKSS